MNRFSFCAAIVATAASISAQASEGHFDVFVGRSDSGMQTAYGGIDVDEGEVFLNQRVFESEMNTDNINNLYFSDEPGFNHPADDLDLPAGVASLIEGDELFVRALPLTVGGIAGNLFYWDGAGAEATFTKGTTVSFDIVTDFANQSIGSAGDGGGFDDHPFFELSAGESLPAPGIYLASFEVQVIGEQPGEEFSASDPLFLVMGTKELITPDDLGLSQPEFDALEPMERDELIDEALEPIIEIAVDFVETNVVPEPSSFIIAGLAVVTTLGCRRRSDG